MAWKQLTLRTIQLMFLKTEAIYIYIYTAENIQKHTNKSSLLSNLPWAVANLFCMVYYIWRPSGESKSIPFAGFFIYTCHDDVLFALDFQLWWNKTMQNDLSIKHDVTDMDVVLCWTTFDNWSGSVRKLLIQAIGDTSVHINL